MGGGDSLSRVAGELERPRVGGLTRAGRVVGWIGLLVTTPLAFLYVVALPPQVRDLWTSAPLVGLALNVSDSRLLSSVLLLFVTITAMIWLSHSTQSALLDADAQLSRLEHHGVVPEFLRLPYARFGTLTDTATAAVLLIVLASSGRVAWLAIAYGMTIAATMVVKVAALARLRTRTPGATFRVPLTLKLRGRAWPIGLWLIWLAVAVAAGALLGFGEVPAFAGVLLIAGVAVALTMRLPKEDHLADAVTQDDFELAPSGELNLERIDAKPGGLLVMVRNPHSLVPLSNALATAGDRDVVVMTVRMLGTGAGEVQFADAQPTSAERELFSAVLSLAERQRATVRLLIVPAHDIIEAVVSAVVRLRSAELHVGESVSLSADAQARLVGQAWEDAVKPDGLTTTLVIYHRSGRTDRFHLGAHVPALTTRDIDQIHAIWLDAVQGVGPHIHHADIVRAALTQMTDQLHGPDREDALRAIRRVAKPADELAAACQARDFSRLHDMVRNRPAQDVAEALTELPIADQVVVYRMLPRKDAAATFEYLSHDDQTALLKAMAKDEVAAILNNMSPDDRTTLLEELPATVTRQMLELLSPEERAVAVKLLGYPENSVGRLMTPHYVRVREHWTVQSVLDHIRKHGQDSETLNVIYVVDEQGVLVDDIRIREFLLTDPGIKVADLMDRHFVSLKATDDQETAIAAFRNHDRTALPVTDSAGVLMGIVTVDDVLEVAEVKATNEIQRIGGSEALDEPYMEIGFFAMIRKRAGWLTALFLGEMLTATAMGAFEAEIAKAVVLAMFVPLIISSGGNAGSQASTLVIRALALGEVGLMDWWRVMRRELLAGLTLGSILGSIGFTRIALWSAFSTIYGEHWFLVAVTVSVALVGIVLWGTVVGSVLPLVLRRLGFDPATSSAPFVATLVDVTGLVIYFSVAMVVLRGTLL
jgi:magnesium transporter